MGDRLRRGKMAGSRPARVPGCLGMQPAQGKETMVECSPFRAFPSRWTSISRTVPRLDTVGDGGGNPVIGHRLIAGLGETAMASASKTPSPPQRARDKFGWWPPLGWVGLISGSHAKKYPRTGHFSNVFCRIFVILCFGGNSHAGRQSAFHGIRLTSGESITPFING